MRSSWAMTVSLNGKRTSGRNACSPTLPCWHVLWLTMLYYKITPPNLVMQNNNRVICKWFCELGICQGLDWAVLIRDLLHSCGQMSVVLWSSKGSTRLRFSYGSYSGCHLMLLSAGCLIGCVRCGLSSRVISYTVVVCPQFVSQDKRLV